MKRAVNMQARLIGQSLISDGPVDFTKVLGGELESFRLPITGTTCSLTIDAYRSAVLDANRSRVASSHELRNCSRLVDAACSRAIPLSTLIGSRVFSRPPRPSTFCRCARCAGCASRRLTAARHTASTRFSTCRVDIDDLPLYFSPPGRWLKAAVEAACSELHRIPSEARS